MYFKGTIVITDPCYIIKENPIKCPNEEDFGLPASISSKPFKDYSTPEELAYKAALDYYFSESRKYDDWGKCDFGENMEVSIIIFLNLLFMDYLSNRGGFCVGVFLLELAYNPDWKSWIEEHSWCATIIEGEVEYYIDKVDEEAHIVGSINFYTAQTGI